MKPSHLLILPFAIMAATSCITITGETDTAIKAKHGVPGGEVVKTTTINATVTGIDSAKCKVTLVTKDGEKFAVKAGPEVVNFDQIRIGDQLKATYTEEIIIRMAKPGEKVADETYVTADLAKVGGKPGVSTSDTAQYVGTVIAIDAKKRKATLQFADGSSKKFDVRPDIDLTKHSVGEKVILRSTESMAIKLEKP
jgi:hypothetical protein